MSYALEFTRRAIRELSNLEIWLQEEALDELELIAAAPLAEPVSPFKSFVHDFIRERGGRRHYVFIAMVWIRTVGGHSKILNPQV